MNNNSLKNLTYNHIPNSEEKVRKEFLLYGLTILEYNYKNTNTRMLCQDSLGYKVFASMSSIHVNKTHQIFSITCNEDNFLYNCHLYEKLNNIESHIISYRKSEIKGHVKVSCLCSCGNTFECDFNAWRRKDKIRCNKCISIISNIANMTKNWLDENNINYIMEYRFNDCKNKKSLPFDFYLPEYNTCIEVDGEQHYYSYSSNHFTGNSDRYNEENLNKTKENDEIKNKYCSEKGIKLIRLKYNLFREGNEKYKEILSKNLIQNN